MVVLMDDHPHRSGTPGLVDASAVHSTTSINIKASYHEKIPESYASAAEEVIKKVHRALEGTRPMTLLELAEECGVVDKEKERCRQRNMTSKEFAEIFNLPDHEDAMDLAMKLDRGFFERHPERDSYTRPAVPGEFPGSENCVLVTQIVPGIRNRNFIDIVPVLWGKCGEKGEESEN